MNNLGKDEENSSQDKSSNIFSSSFQKPKSHKQPFFKLLPIIPVAQKGSESMCWFKAVDISHSFIPLYHHNGISQLEISHLSIGRPL